MSIGDDWTVFKNEKLHVFRAVDTSPEKIKTDEKWLPRNPEPFLLKKHIAQLLEDPRGFAQSHVSNNFKWLHSCALDEECAGYTHTRAYTYEIVVLDMNRFEPPPARSRILTRPAIWSNGVKKDLSDATRVAFDPRKQTEEIDLMFDLELDMIKRYKEKGGEWKEINWDLVGKER